MQQNYEVHIDGKRFVIGTGAEHRNLPRNWISVHVERQEEMDLAKRTLVRHADLRGLRAFGDDPEQLWEWFRRGYHPVEAAGGAVTDPAGRLLAIHRLGRWDLPKGKVEPGEALDEAALREVQEECGLRDLRIRGPLCRTWHTYPRNGQEHLKCTHWFLMDGDPTEKLVAQTEEDIDQVRWLDAAAVERMRGDTYPSLLRVLNAWEVSLHGRG